MTAQIAKVATQEDLQAVQPIEEVLDLRTQAILAELKKKLRKGAVDYETEKAKILALITRYRELQKKLVAFRTSPKTIVPALEFWEFVQLEELAYLFRNVEKQSAWVSGLYLGREGTHDVSPKDFTRDPFKSFNPLQGKWDKHNRFWNRFKYWNELFEVEGWNGVSNPKLFFEEVGKKRLADPVFWKLQVVAKQEYEKWKAYRREQWKKRYHRHHKKIVTVSWFGNFWFLIENGRPRGPGRTKGSRDSYPRIRNPYAGESGERRYQDKDREIEVPQIEEQCANCKKFAELKNGYNYYTGTPLKLCEECLESDSRFRRGNPTLYCKFEYLGCDFTTKNKEVLERHEKTHDLSDRARRYREGEDVEESDEE
ncbi:MAG TPA: hypothetical protein VGS11_11905 [Candidatus Bathyarchaeia archaeon]|nr:hypothetical protein [Candidatus Bathyarchaeia archaeon]